MSELPEDLAIRIERAHWHLADKPSAEQAPPRFIIVRFLDHYMNDVVLEQAWVGQVFSAFCGKRTGVRIRIGK